MARISALGRVGALSLALAAVLAFMIEAADARVGGGGSYGSRGTRTYTAPPTTQTAPTPAKPVEQSMTQPSTAAVKQANTPPVASRFGTGFGGLLLGGLLGAGLFGLLTGAGLFGGLTGLASFLGLMLQVALIAGLAYAALAFFRRRREPALARGPAGAGPVLERNGVNSASSTSAATPAASPLLIGSADYDAFERLLGEIQSAFSREDVDALGAMTTPEMLSYFSRELADNKDTGVRNEVADVKLLQGDLSEAWREGHSEYATVAMHFSLRDSMVDRTTGRVVSGDGSQTQQVTEVWTFRRDHREPLQGWQQGWQLSAIQQAA
ncbi:MAG TPA: TIM44-like domain-containing protein [Hyphomicrobiaceae bacterium]|nr:TIM44-like domain-containing protein [Hyphomicrobiaceae bacterium]